MDSGMLQTKVGGYWTSRRRVPSASKANKPIAEKPGSGIAVIKVNPVPLLKDVVSTESKFAEVTSSELPPITTNRSVIPSSSKCSAQNKLTCPIYRVLEQF